MRGVSTLVGEMVAVERDAPQPMMEEEKEKEGRGSEARDEKRQREVG
jgi:hypothetical protein